MIRSIAQFHEREDLFALAPPQAGRLLVWVAGIALLLWHETTVLMPVSFTLVLIFPRQRRLLLAFAAVGMILQAILRIQGVVVDAGLVSTWIQSSLPLLRLMAQVAAVIFCAYLVHAVAIRFDRFPKLVRQFPVLTLHSVVWMALALSSLPAFGILSYTHALVWRLSYVFASAARGNARERTFRDHAFYLFPVFGGPPTPYGKGLDYLTRCEALDPKSAGQSQLAGIKLLILAAYWFEALRIMNAAIYGQSDALYATWFDGWSLGASSLAMALRIEGGTSIPLGWSSIYLELIRNTLSLAVNGHIVVGCLRLLGFNVFRNTYKPLLSSSVVEFWNRFNFYFKELLVEFFFYPAYLRMTSLNPALRLFVAVFAAAFLGNMYFHVLNDFEPVIRFDFATVWVNWGPRLIYCFLLALGIWISMLREQKRRAAGSAMSKLRVFGKIAGVWTFYAAIQIWNVRAPDIGFAERFRFAVSLLGF
jgi:hypothetical protein